MGRSSSTATTTLDVLASTAAEADPVFAGLPKYMKAKWSELMLSNLFRRISYKELVSRSTKLFGKVDVKAMWRACTADGYVVKNIKAWLFWCAKKGLRGDDAVVAAVKFEIRPEDRGLRLSMNADLRAHLAKMAQQYAALSLQTLDRQVVGIFQEMRDWLGKFVYRKMRFVYEQQGLAAWDMQMEVFAKGIHALYLSYPKVETKLHATNIVKSAAHNYGINIIIQATNDGKARLVRGADNTFTSRVVNIDDAAVGTSLATEDVRVDHERAHDLKTTFARFGFKGRKTDVDLTWLLTEGHDPKNADKLNEAISKMSRPQRIIALCMGVEDQEFSNWLNTSKHRIRSSGSDYLDKADPVRFMNLAFEFLEVDPAKGTAFVNRLRKRLHAYSH